MEFIREGDILRISGKLVKVTRLTWEHLPDCDGKCMRGHRCNPVLVIESKEYTPPIN